MTRPLPLARELAGAAVIAAVAWAAWAALFLVLLEVLK